MKFLDMSQYEGPDREQVVTGWKIVMGLKYIGIDRSTHTAPDYAEARVGVVIENSKMARIDDVARWVAIGSKRDSAMLSYLTAVDFIGGTDLSDVQAASVLAYLKANDQALKVIARLKRSLTPKPASNTRSESIDLTGTGKFKV